MKVICKIFLVIKSLMLRGLGKEHFIYYFSEVKNVGDDLNVDLIEFYSNKKAACPPLLSKFEHTLMVGSIIHEMNTKSVVLGSGLIHPSFIRKISGLGNIKALRGELTKKYIEEEFNVKLDVPLGDFALLMPRVIKCTNFEKKYKFGVVLHYKDKEHEIVEYVQNMGGKIIDVGQKVDFFVKELVSCEMILSSSMHGLILSDAYGIPNKRIVLSDLVTGGDFKFQDYYSTTYDPDNYFGYQLSHGVTEEEIKKVLELTTVKKYRYCLDELESVLKEALA